MIHQWIGFFVASKHINYILHEFAPVKYSNSKKRIHNKNFGAIVETTAQFSLVTKPVHDKLPFFGKKFVKSSHFWSILAQF